MDRKFVCVVCLAIIFPFIKSQVLSAGSNCKASSDKNGECRLLKDCPSAKRLIAEFGVWPTTCSVKNGVSLICCEGSGSSGGFSSLPEPTKPLPSRRPETPVTPATALPRPPPSKAKRNYGIVSRSKCDEYSRWLNSYSPVTGKTSKSSGQCDIYGEKFILNGTKTRPLEFPHMVHLGFTHGDERDTPVYACAGSLISDQWVLTAGHCLRKSDGSNITHAKLGTGDSQSTIVVKVAELVPHKSYTRNHQYYDIAMIKLEEKIEFDNFRRPACLQVNKGFQGNEVIATGWGKTENNRQSDALLKVKLPVVSFPKCTGYYQPSPKLEQGLDDRMMLCAGGQDTGADTCQGDSGGPLQILLNEPYCMYSVIGITSFGKSCGKVPGVYTRVSIFVPWIETVVWPDLIPTRT